MPERPNGAVSKTVVSSNGHRGFKSHSLRHANTTRRLTGDCQRWIRGATARQASGVFR